MPINDFLGDALNEFADTGKTTATPGAPAPSFLDDAVDAVGAQSRARNHVGALQSLQADPDKFAEFQDLGKTFGVPVDFVGRNYDTLKREAQIGDIRRLLDKNPALGRWYTEGDNPAAIKVDELRHLSGLAWLGMSAWDSFNEGRSNVDLANARYRQLLGMATDEEIAAANELSSSRTPRSYAADTWLQRGWTGAAQQLPIMGETLLGGVEGGVQGAVAGGTAALVAGQLGPQIAVPEEIVTVPGAAAVGYKIGAAAGQYQATFRLEAGLAFDEYLAMRDEAGQPLDPDVARTAAVITGAINGGLELVGLRTMSKIVPGLDRIARTFTGDAVKMALARPTVQEAFKNFGVNALKSATTETMTEVAQEAVTMFAGILAQEYSGQEFPAVTGEDVAERLGGALQKTMETMTVLGPVLSGTRLGHDVNRARRASQDQAVIDAIIDHAEGNELAQRLPDKAREAVRAITENGPINSVFIDPRAFQEFFQDSADLSRFAATTGLTEELNEAIRTGREVEVPIDVYAVSIAATEFGQATRNYVKFSPDNMSSVEADSFNEAWAEAQRSLAEEFQDRQRGEQQALEATEVIHQDVKAKAMDAGIVPDQAEQYARLYSTFFRVMSERTLQDPGELYARYGFDIRRALPGMAPYREADGLSIALELIRRGRIPGLRKRVEKARGTSMLARIQQRGGIVDVGGELAAMDARQIIRPGEAGLGDFNQFTPDDTLRQLWEEGYFPEFQERPDLNALWDAISEELGGTPRYSVQEDRSADAEVQRAQELVSFADTLEELGLDPSFMDEEAIRAELDRLANEDPDTAALYQAAADAIASALDGAPVAELFQEEGEATGPQTTKRGSIQFGDGQTVINLFDQANLSTFLHESGHFFLEVFRDLSAMENAPPELLQDWNIVREYLGIGEAAENIPTAAHEKFARTFEAYLFEGKAPSNEVAGIMARFRSWLVFVYKAVSQLDVPINDKIRGVMDRMIATDDEVRAASFSPEFRPAFKNAAEAGMTETQWARYLETAGRAVEETKRNLTTRMLNDVSRETTREWRAARKEIREAVQREYEKLPVYQAINYLRTGKADLPNIENVDRMYLDKAAVEQIMGEGAVLKLPRSAPPIYRVKGGVHPDMLAELFGFASGYEMLLRMMSVPPMARAINEETGRRMRERFGDLMGDAVARSREVSAAVANDATGDLLAAEMEVLMKKGLVTSRIRKEDARRVASETIRAKPVREAIRTKLYMNANARAAQEAEQAILAGRWVDAVAAKQRQLLNHYMAMEAVQVEKEVRQAVDYLNRFTGRKRPKNIDPEYLDQIEQLLEKFDMRKAATLKQSQRRASLAAWIEQQEAIGNIVTLPDGVREDAFRKSYKDMSVDDLNAVRDAVKNIEHLGRLKNELLLNKERREREAVRDEMIAAIAASADRRPALKTRNPTLMDRGWEFARSLENLLVKLEQAFEWMDGGDPNGPFNRYIWRPISEAQSREGQLNEEYTGKVMRIFAGLDKTRLSERITIPGIDRTFLRSEIMAVALNMGNESNLDKMMRGEGWDKSPAILDRVVAHLNEAEWAAVQQIWDTINELWPEIEAVQRRLTGVAPPKVEAREFVTPTGQKLTGGYYPMIYDPRQVDAATAEGRAIIRAQAVTDRRLAADDMVQFENVYLRPETRHGFTKERAQKFAMPILFDLDGLGRHLIAVIHDVTHREALINANKLLTDPYVRGEIESRYGRELYMQIVPWLQNIAHDAYKKDGLAPAERLFRGIRSRGTVLAIGFRASTILAQLAGIGPSFEVLIPAGSKNLEGTRRAVKFMSGAIKDFTTSPKQMWDTVYTKSPAVRERMQTRDRDIRDKLNELTGKTDFVSRAQKFAFYGIGYMDRAVSAPTWLAAYRMHLADNPTDEAGAIAAGDHAVSLSQGGGRPMDLAAVQRNSELTKLVTMFYSYFSAYYNRQRNWARDAKKAIANGEYREFPDLLARQVFMTIIPALMGELLVGRGPDDGDDEGWGEWAIKEIAFYPFTAVPIGRDIAAHFKDGYDYTLSPAQRTLNDAVIKPFQVIGDIWDGDADPRKATRAFINAVGLWFGLPTGQLATTTNNIWLGIEQDDFKLQDIVLSRPEKR